MAANSDISRYEDLVYDLLNRYTKMRDDTSELYLACIMSLRGMDYVTNTTLRTFFIDHRDKKDLPKIPSMASVIRLSTKLQKEHPHLRGIYWEKRQKHSKDYQEDLGYGQ